MRPADFHTRLFKVFVGTLLCWSSLKPADGKSLVSNGVANGWLEMTRLYRESSVYMFHELLTALQMDATEFARRSGQHEDRLRGYMKGELFLDEMELDTITSFVNDVREIVRKFYGGDLLSDSPKAYQLLYGVIAEVREFKQHARIETAVQELRARGEELTTEQERLVSKVDAISYDAFARLKHNVTIADSNRYAHRNQTSAEILAEILASLRMVVPEFAIHSKIYTARLFDYQRGEIIFNDEDLQKINVAIDRAIAKLSANPRQRKRHRRPLLGKNTHARAEVELHLKRLLERFNDAVRVERYLHDRNR